MKRISLTSLADAFPREMSRALALMGHYVYAYYRPNEVRPFYVGKGSGSRVLNHWKNAIRSPSRAHEKEILAILKEGRMPVVKLLAYNLEKTNPEDVNLTVERALQDAFGIQKVWQKRGGSERLVEHGAGLLQTREDSAKSPVLSLEAVLAKATIRDTVNLQNIAEMLQVPVLMVGLSKTYHPSYGSMQVAEMARMYWALDIFRNTALKPFRSAGNPVLLAWSSQVNKSPMIVGAWRIKPGSVRKPKGLARYEMKVTEFEDLSVRKSCLGLRLEGRGSNWQGPRFAFPENS